MDFLISQFPFLISLLYLCHKPKNYSYTDMKKIAFLLLMLLPLGVAAQKQQDMSKYLAGAVTEQNGIVVFEKSYNVPGKTKVEIHEGLKTYLTEVILNNENALPQTRIQDDQPEAGTLAIAVEEFLYFKRKALVTDGTRFYYQLVTQAEDGKFTITMRRIRYIYDLTETPSTEVTPDVCFTAEKWITDAEALNKSQTKLLKIPGKFRRFTIDRKDEIFNGAAKAVGAERKVKMVEVYE